MYVTPRFPFDPLMLTCLGLIVFGFGVMLMIEAGRAAVRGAPTSRVEREGRLGVRLAIGGMALLVVSLVWTVFA